MKIILKKNEMKNKRNYCRVGIENYIFIKYLFFNIKTQVEINLSEFFLS